MELSKLVGDGFGFSISGSGLYDCEESMKTLGIIGIVLSGILIIMCLSMITSEGMWWLTLAFGYFLAISIMAVKCKCK